MPTCKLALLCDGIDQNRSTGVYSLIGIFQNIEASQNPNGINFLLVVYWGGDVGETFQQSFTVKNSYGNLINKSPETPITIESESHVSINPFNGAIPAKPGKYTINININGVRVDATTIVVT